MKITAQEYFKCEKCGKEARGMADIDKLFGYRISEEELSPYSMCKECRGEVEVASDETLTHMEKKYATAFTWGRKIHISPSIFNSYLLDLGYLERTKAEDGKRSMVVVTDAAKHHSMMKKTIFGKVILWDFATYLAVAKLRVEKAEIYDCCPKCNSYLRIDTERKYPILMYRCSNCGQAFDKWSVSMVFDR